MLRCGDDHLVESVNREAAAMCVFSRGQGLRGAILRVITRGIVGGDGWIRLWKKFDE